MEALPVKHKMLKGFMLQGLCNPSSSEIDFIPYKHPVTGTQIGSAAFARGAAIVQISDRAYDILISSFPVAKLKYIDDDGEDVMVSCCSCLDTAAATFPILVHAALIFVLLDTPGLTMHFRLGLLPSWLIG